MKVIHINTFTPGLADAYGTLHTGQKYKTGTLYPGYQVKVAFLKEQIETLIMVQSWNPSNLYKYMT